jgi:hypothetical protein
MPITLSSATSFNDDIGHQMTSTTQASFKYACTVQKPNSLTLIFVGVYGHNLLLKGGGGG